MSRFCINIGIIILAASTIGAPRILAQRVPASPTLPARPAAPVRAVKPRAIPPQVLTVVRRLSGTKVLSVLSQGGQPVVSVDDQLINTRRALTNITAGFALGEGNAIAVWFTLPEAQLNFVPAINALPPGPSVLPTWPTPDVAAVPPPPPVVSFPHESDLFVIRRDGERIAAKYIGIDGGTGLSVIMAPGVTEWHSDDADERQLQEGTRVRLIAPEQAKTASIAGTSTGTLRLKVAEKKATLSSVARTGGKVMLITVVSQDLSPALVGGVVVTEAGQTVGLVQSTTPSEAKVLPVAVVRSAAFRVLARTPVAPGPWLGVRGEALTGATFEQLESLGWPKEVADSLIKQQRGILLTTVVPGTPAQLGELKPGDVLVNVNDGDIVTNEDLSSVLNNIDRDLPVRLKLLRPNVFAPIDVTVKLGRSLDPVTATVIAERRALALAHGERLSRFGVETFMISERTASRLGSRGGLFVLSVQPGSAGYRAGLRSEDVIESIDGSPAASFDHKSLPRPAPAIRLSLIRDARRLELLLQPDQQEP